MITHRAAARSVSQRRAGGDAILAVVRRSALVSLIASAGAIAAAVIAAPPASGAVQISSSTITVSGRGAIATVQRDPFRLSFGTGQAELSEVPGGQPLPSPLAATADPVAPGTEPAQSGQLYAPLAYLVGVQTVQQYSGLVWGGNLMSGERDGVQYFARAVQSVVRTGGGVSMKVSTDEGPGRTLQVMIVPAGRGLIRVRVTPHPSTGIALMSDSFSSPPGEGFYGFGGRHNAIDQRGQDLASFVEEENIPPGENSPPAGSPPSAVLFPNGPSAAYYPQAQFISSRGYGFLLQQPQLAWFRLDSDRPDAWSVAAAADSLSYVVASGGFDRSIGSLTRLTGRQPVPARWELGPMLDREVRNVGETTASYEAEVRSDLANIKRYRLPVTAYRIEGWGLPGSGNDGLSLHSYVSFGFQRRIIRQLHRRHIHPLAYLRPWITPGSAPDQAGYAIRTATGSTYYTTSTTGTRIALLDFTNPAAVAYWDREVVKTLNLGFDGFMADFGEEVLDDMHFHGGQTGSSMHNEYPVLYMKVTRQAVRAWERRHHRTIFVFNRAGYSGAPGSAAYEDGNFPGDEATNWTQASGLASLAPDMLGRAIGGAFGYATDIGGYYDYTTPPTTKSLFLRWAEWAALSPIFRLHGSGRQGTHTPWSYDRQTVRVYKDLSALHERAAGYIRTLWKQADRTGIPPTRPLWLQFPRDRAAAGVEQEWMLGRDLLVAPVVTQGATSLHVTFPPGCWRDPQTRLKIRGPRVKSIRAPLGRLPFFFRCGTHPFRST
jgi:alpha-glucosidase